MSPPKKAKEREDTDASLLAERDKTDAELDRTNRSAHEDEDRVVKVPGIAPQRRWRKLAGALTTR